jgi:hypothetical protein
MEFTILFITAARRLAGMGNFDLARKAHLASKADANWVKEVGLFSTLRPHM